MEEHYWARSYDDGITSISDSRAHHARRRLLVGMPNVFTAITDEKYPDPLSAILAEPTVFGYTEHEVRQMCDAKTLSIDLSGIETEHDG